MKKLSTLFFALFATSLFATAATTNDLSRGYDNSFIFQEGGIEFAVFPDGQFDFNYLDNVSRVDFRANTPAVSISYNNGFDYDAFVQYDTYGAVIQIENTPIFYDEYGRIAQAGNVFINYRNGFVNRVGNLNVYYSRPGVIFRTTGFINSFNRFYVYQPWHGFYGVPLVNRCVVWNSPYRLYYNPIRYDWAYHRLNWNRPFYYNGVYSDLALRRSFYRPYDRVAYQSFERGRRDTRGRLITDRNTIASRESITTGRRAVSRDRSAYTAADRNASYRGTTNSAVATTGRYNSRSTNTIDSNRTSRRTTNDANTNAPARSTSRTATATVNSNTRSNATRVNDRTSTVSSNDSRSSRTNNSRTATVQTQRSERSATLAPQRNIRSASSVTSQRTERSNVVAPQRNHRSTPVATPQRSNSRSSQAITPSRSTESKGSTTRSSSSNRSSRRG